MSTDTKVVVSDADIQAVESQVKGAEQTAMKAVEERVRKEIQSEQRASELEAKLAQQIKETETAREEAAKARADSEALIKQQAEHRLRSEETRSRVPVNAANPFRESIEKKTIDAADVAEIGRSSYEAFLKATAKPR